MDFFLSFFKMTARETLTMCNICALLVCLESRLYIGANLVISYQFKHSVQLCQF